VCVCVLDVARCSLLHRFPICGKNLLKNHLH